VKGVGWLRVAWAAWGLGGGGDKTAAAATAAEQGGDGGVTVSSQTSVALLGRTVLAYVMHKRLTKLLHQCTLTVCHAQQLYYRAVPCRAVLPRAVPL